VLQHAQWFGHFQIEEAKSDTPETGSPTGKTPLASILPEQQSGPAPAPQPIVHNELTALWDRAVAGEEAEVYRQLMQRSEGYPGDTDLMLRLYWLLALTPELDPERNPCDWLVRVCLQVEDLAHFASFIVATLLPSRPRRCRSDSHDSHQPDGFWRLADFVEWRWTALAQLRPLDILAEDVPALRERLLREGEETWLRLLFLIADRVAWVGQTEAVDLFVRVKKEIESHDHLASRLGWCFDRLDYLEVAALSWRYLEQLESVPPEFLQLMPLTWKPTVWSRAPVAPDRPRTNQSRSKKWLGHLDDVLLHSPATLQQFVGLVQELEAQTERSSADEHEPEVLTALVNDFLDSQGMLNYSDMRGLLLDFCLREAVRPEQVAELSGTRPANWPNTGELLAQAARSDGPLQAVYKAHEVFWAE